MCIRDRVDGAVDPPPLTAEFEREFIGPYVPHPVEAGLVKPPGDPSCPVSRKPYHTLLTGQGSK